MPILGCTLTSVDEASSVVTGCLGLRVVIALAMNMPIVLLLTVVPCFAISQGIVQNPDILLSDMMASGNLMRSLYSCGLSLCCMAMIMQWSEVVRFIKAQTQHPEARRVLDQFLATVWFLVIPCTLILVSFMFEEAKVSEGSSFLAIVPSDAKEFTQWLFLVLAATFCFFGLGVCAYLYVVHIAPHSLKEGIEPRGDVACKSTCCKGIIAACLCGVPVRLLHIGHSREVWAVPLLLVEIFVLLLGVSASVLGTLGVMSHLDATEPLIQWSNLLPGAWAGTLRMQAAHPNQDVIETSKSD